MQIFRRHGPVARHAPGRLLDLGPRPAPMDGPDEVHLRTVARQVLARRAGPGQPHGLTHTTPSSLAAPPHLQVDDLGLSWPARLHAFRAANQRSGSASTLVGSTVSTTRRGNDARRVSLAASARKLSQHAHQVAAVAQAALGHLALGRGGPPGRSSWLSCWATSAGAAPTWLPNCDSVPWPSTLASCSPEIGRLGTRANPRLQHVAQPRLLKALYQPRQPAVRAIVAQQGQHGLHQLRVLGGHAQQPAQATACGVAPAWPALFKTAPTTESNKPMVLLPVKPLKRQAGWPTAARHGLRAGSGRGTVCVGSVPQAAIGLRSQWSTCANRGRFSAAAAQRFACHGRAQGGQPLLALGVGHGGQLEDETGGGLALLNHPVPCARPVRSGP